MLAKTYAAFKAAGVDEDQAQAAAEELAAFEVRFASMKSSLCRIDGKLMAIERKLNVAFLLIGVNAAAAIAILGVLLHRG